MTVEGDIFNRCCVFETENLRNILAVLTLIQKLFVLDSNQNSFHLFETGLQGARNKRVET